MKLLIYTADHSVPLVVESERITITQQSSELLGDGLTLLGVKVDRAFGCHFRFPAPPPVQALAMENGSNTFIDCRATGEDTP